MTAPTAPLALNLALMSAALLGFKHGFDYDHIAAITDIASVQRNPRQAMRMGLMYALGHAATVTVLGVAVIFFQLRLPQGIDNVMERFVGFTLLVLGLYVLWTTIFPRHAHPHGHGPRTRITLLMNGLLWLIWRVRQWFSPQPVQRTQLFGDGIGKAPSFVVGIVHGVGAETTSQIMLFLLAANLGGVGLGLLGIGMFVAGMLVMNTLMCAAAAGLFRFSRRGPGAFKWVAGLSAAYSILLGLFFLAGPAAQAAVLGR
jgi:High-affinity nickel-transport protein